MLQTSPRSLLVVGDYQFRVLELDLEWQQIIIKQVCVTNTENCKMSWCWCVWLEKK